MLKATCAILPCSCLPWFKQADNKIKKAAVCELTGKQPSLIGASTTSQQRNQHSARELAQDTVSLSSPAEGDPDTTITAIEASIEPSNEDETAGQIDEEKQTELNLDSKRASAPPILELNIPHDHLPDFSLNSRSRLSYWGPPPFLPPECPLPDTPIIRLRQPQERSNRTSFYSAYYRGEETVDQGSAAETCKYTPRKHSTSICLED